MTDYLSRIRDIAMLLPGTTEDVGERETRFLVEGEAFARLSGDGACCRSARRTRATSRAGPTFRSATRPTGRWLRIGSRGAGNCGSDRAAGGGRAMSGSAGDEAADRAKSRRRLLTLAEFVAVAAGCAWRR